MDWVARDTRYRTLRYKYMGKVPGAYEYVSVSVWDIWTRTFSVYNHYRWNKKRPNTTRELITHHIADSTWQMRMPNVYEMCVYIEMRWERLKAMWKLFPVSMNRCEYYTHTQGTLCVYAYAYVFVLICLYLFKWSLHIYIYLCVCIVCAFKRLSVTFRFDVKIENCQQNFNHIINNEYIHFIWISKQPKFSTMQKHHMKSYYAAAAAVATATPLKHQQHRQYHRNFQLKCLETFLYICCVYKMITIHIHLHTFSHFKTRQGNSWKQWNPYKWKTITIPIKRELKLK